MLLEITVLPVTRECVGPDAVGLVVALVVVYHEFRHTITVDIGVGDRVGREDGSVIDDARVNQGTIQSRNSVVGYPLVEELSSKHNDFTTEKVFDDVNPNIGASSDDMLDPLATETLLRVLVPDEFATAHLSVGFGGDEVFAAVQVHVNPKSHVVEVPILVVSDGVGLSHLRDVVRIDRRDVHTAVRVSRHQKSIRNDDGALLEHIPRHNLDLVGPLHVLDPQFLGDQTAHFARLHSGLDIGHDVDASVADGAESRAEEEVVTVIELGHLREGGIVQLELAQGLPGDVGGGYSGGSENSGSEGSHLVVSKSNNYKLWSVRLL